MAAIAHSDPYAIFMRKVGYSAGLENTLARFADLEKLYLYKGDVTLATWRELVHGAGGWELSTENIADVFSSLRLIKQTMDDVLVLEILDSSAITSRLLNNDLMQEKARAFLFLWTLILNDGEIFINMLLSDFNDDTIRTKLLELIEYKRAVLNKIFPGKDSIRRIARIVNIDRQEKNKGSAGTGKTVQSLKRTDPLPKSGGFNEDKDSDFSVTISSDYFRKVPPKRKEWARSLGLWNNKTGLTDAGKVLKATLIECGYILENGIFVFWPMDFELVRSGFRPDLLPSTKSLWDAIVEIGMAFSGLKISAPSDEDSDSVVDLVQRMVKIFQSLHTRKSMLRRELPLTIAYPVAVALACANGAPLMDYSQALAAEQQGDKRRIALRRSRNTGGALSLRR